MLIYKRLDITTSWKMIIFVVHRSRFDRLSDRFLLVTSSQGAQEGKPDRCLDTFNNRFC